MTIFEILPAPISFLCVFSQEMDVGVGVYFDTKHINPPTTLTLS